MADEAFNALMGQLDPAMAVVTTAARGENAGCLIGFHAQCSIEPGRYVVWLSKANHTCRVALHADHLVVHFLDEADGDLAELFGTLSGDDVDKFERCAWTPGPADVPVLTRCGNRLVARRVAVLDEGSDHVCVVVEPVDAATDGRLRPLRLSAVNHLVAGHSTDERPLPPTERSL